MKRSASPKRTKSIEEKPPFIQDLEKKCIELNIDKKPIGRVLNAEIKPGHPWTTFAHQRNSRNIDNTEIIIYIANENFEKSGNITKIIIKNQRIEDNFLSAFVETVKNFNTLTTLRLEFCDLTANGINMVQSILTENQNIIDLSLDGNPNLYQNYYLVLKDTNIKYLSLKRCKINEIGLKELCKELSFTSNNSLTMLNLSGNYIDDSALVYLVQALRQNRKITCLLLTDNWITDNGCGQLMSVFQRFTLTHNECVIKRKINLQYFAQKNILLKQYNENRLQKEDSIRTFSSIKSQKKSSKISTKDKSSSYISKSSVISGMSETQKIKQYMDKMLPKNLHPFISESTPENGEIYCIGNYKLNYLNLAYNKITSRGYQSIIESLKYQLQDDTMDTGIFYIILDGNPANNCLEHQEIKSLLQEQRWKYLNKGNSKTKISQSEKRSVSKYSSLQVS